MPRPACVEASRSAPGLAGPPASDPLLAGASDPPDLSTYLAPSWPWPARHGGRRRLLSRLLLFRVALFDYALLFLIGRAFRLAHGISPSSMADGWSREWKPNLSHGGPGPWMRERFRSWTCATPALRFWTAAPPDLLMPEPDHLGVDEPARAPRSARSSSIVTAPTMSLEIGELPSLAGGTEPVMRRDGSRALEAESAAAWWSDPGPPSRVPQLGTPSRPEGGTGNPPRPLHRRMLHRSCIVQVLRAGGAGAESRA